MEHANRRKEDRFSISQLIEMGFGKERWVHARGIDISRNGFRGVLSEEIDSGSSMFVLFRIHEQSVKLEAVAVHVAKTEDGAFEAGFHFTSVDPDAQAAIDEYIASVAQSE